MHDFDAQGVAVYALSYDEPDALRDFREAHGITFHLLSDPDSRVIKSFGILNTLIDPSDHPWYGIPYPGTYILDADGVITHKFFDSNLAVRAGAEQLLAAVQGRRVSQPASTAAEPNAVQVEVALAGEALASTVLTELVATFSVPAGRHVYAEPAPEGSVAVELVLDANERLVQRPLVRPASEPHQLAGTAEQFEVHHNQFEVRLPLTLNNAATERVQDITLTGELRWQSCDDEVCDIPSKQRFELTVAVAAAPALALGSKAGAELEPNAAAHFQRMSTRRVADES